MLGGREDDAPLPAVPGGRDRPSRRRPLRRVRGLRLRPGRRRAPREAPPGRVRGRTEVHRGGGQRRREGGRRGLRQRREVPRLRGRRRLRGSAQAGAPAEPRGGDAGEGAPRDGGVPRRPARRLRRHRREGDWRHAAVGRRGPREEGARHVVIGEGRRDGGGGGAIPQARRGCRGCSPGATGAARTRRAASAEEVYKAGSLRPGSSCAGARHRRPTRPGPRARPRRSAGGSRPPPRGRESRRRRRRPRGRPP